MKNIKLEISHNLLDSLNKIKDRSKIANLLLGEINPKLLVDDYSNYLDISNNDSSKISYVNKQRKEKILENGFDIWTTYNYRYESKPGAILLRIFNKNVFDNKDIEHFSNLFKSVLFSDRYNFSIISGNKLKKWYHYDKYSDNGGSLGRSCMRYDCCQNYLDIYPDNNVEMLILTDSDNLLVGRALLWKAKDVVTGEMVNVLDRIYTNNDDELPLLFKNWAQKNNYIYRKNQSWDSSMNWIENDEIVEKRLSILLENYNYDNYPYLDTFKFLTSDGYLTNYIPCGFSINSNNKILISAEGSYLDSDALVMDDITHLFLNREDATFLPNESIYTSFDNVTYSNILGRYILTTDAKYIDEIDDYIFQIWDRNPQSVKEYVSDIKQIEVESF